MNDAMVAVFNSDPDTVAMLHLALQQAGYRTIDAPLREFQNGVAGGLAFLRLHQPDVVVYDVSPPFEVNAAYCCDLQEADGARAWVITSTDPARTYRDLRGRPERYELIGKPYNLDDVVIAVQRAVGRTAALRKDRRKPRFVDRARMKGVAGCAGRP
jgi:DNA-binding response OmpR family regulator